MANEEPHRYRCTAILRDHPEIKQLYRHEWRTHYMVADTVILQMVLTTKIVDLGWRLVFLGDVCSSCGESFIDLSDSQIEPQSGGFKQPFHNQISSVFVDVQIGVLYSASFKPYHTVYHP